jgi:iron complex outermembrane receptor protein
VRAPASRGAAAALALWAFAAGGAWAQADGTVVGRVVVTAPAPLGGPLMDADKLPITVETLSADDLEHGGSRVVTEALAQKAAGVSLSDSQGNGFTRELNFRGFTASPLQGTPEGLAVYMGGVRLNEAFGDTVNWDLIPEVAVEDLGLFTANPAFGLNALGGAVRLRMKTAADAPGPRASLEGGAFGRLYGSAESGAARGPWSVYLAADGGREDGWRLHSPSTIARAYADLGWRAGRAEAHLALAGAANSFGVVGPTPVDLLVKDRRATYTWPQTSGNHAGLVALSGKLGLGKAWTVQADAYARRFNQHHLDGNDGNFQDCGEAPSDPLHGTLCVQDGGFPDAGRPPEPAFQVLGQDGAPIPCPPTAACEDTPYGTLDRTRTAALSWGASAQATSTGRLLGLGNLFAAGASLDRSRVRFSASSTLAVVRPDLELGPDPAVPGTGQVIATAGAIAYNPVELNATTTYWGLYATDTLDLTRRLSATVSARLNLARVSMADLTGTSPDLNGAHRFDRLNPAAGLAYRASGALTIYGGWSQANRAPTPLELACSDPARPCLLENALVADPPLKQVTARTWEAGLRGSPRLGGGVLDWRLSLFQADNRDDIVATASAIQGRGSYANVPGTRRRGLEASVDWRARRWRAWAAYSRIEATYRFSGALPSPNSPFADAAGNVQVRPGDRIGGIPADRFKAGAELQATGALTLGADLQAVGPQYLIGDEANQDARLPGYWTADVHAAVRLRPGVELYGRIENLFDRRYATYGTYFEADGLAALQPSPLPDNPDPRSVTPAPPRAFLVGLRARW